MLFWIHKQNYKQLKNHLSKLPEINAEAYKANIICFLNYKSSKFKILINENTKETTIQ